MSENMDDPGDHAKLKKSVTNSHMLNDCINMKYPEYMNP